MTATESNQFVWEQSHKAAGEWFNLLCRNPYAELYLWHTRGELRVASDKPGSDWELSTGERLRGGCNLDQMKRKIHEVAVRLPCLPTE